VTLRKRKEPGLAARMQQRMVDRVGASSAASLNADNVVRWHRLLGPNSGAVMKSLSQQVDLLREAGRPEEAVVVARSLLDKSSARYGPDDRRSLAAEMQIANNLGRLGRFDEADPYLVHILSITGEDPKTYIALSAAAWHGCCLVELGHAEEAESFLVRARELYQQHYGDERSGPELFVSEYLARALIAQHRIQEAIPVQQAVVELSQRNHGLESPARSIPHWSSPH
jgi:tetratricopeptide (TPR) repeat protein